MRQILCAMVCLSVLASPAWAKEDPIPGREDARMRTLPYDPGQVVHLSTAVGATLVVASHDARIRSAFDHVYHLGVAA